MTREEKDLLFKDLSARLPYKVIVEFISYEGDTSPWFGELSCKDLDCFIHDVEYIEIKPYLRPMASMTEEEREEFNKVIGVTLKDLENDELFSCLGTIAEVDFYHKNHFDYRGLIEKGLALEAPKEMYN